jgi:serine/threonine protein kinase
MVMKRCECGLMDVFRNYGLTYLDMLGYAMQIAKAMQYLHHNRIIHRNLKVSNILVRTHPRTLPHATHTATYVLPYMCDHRRLPSLSAG